MVTTPSDVATDAHVDSTLKSQRLRMHCWHDPRSHGERSRARHAARRCGVTRHTLQFVSYSSFARRAQLDSTGGVLSLNQFLVKVLYRESTHCSELLDLTTFGGCQKSNRNDTKRPDNWTKETAGTCDVLDLSRRTVQCNYKFTLLGSLGGAC